MYVSIGFSHADDVCILGTFVFVGIYKSFTIGWI